MLFGFHLFRGQTPNPTADAQNTVFYQTRRHQASASLARSPHGSLAYRANAAVLPYWTILARASVNPSSPLRPAPLSGGTIKIGTKVLLRPNR